MLGPGVGLGPVDGHDVAKVAGQRPPHLTLVHDLLLRADLQEKYLTSENRGHRRYNIIETRVSSNKIPTVFQSSCLCIRIH